MNGERKNKPDEDQSRSNCVVVVDLDDGAVLLFSSLCTMDEWNWRREKSGPFLFLYDGIGVEKQGLKNDENVPPNGS